MIFCRNRICYQSRELALQHNIVAQRPIDYQQPEGALWSFSENHFTKYHQSTRYREIFAFTLQLWIFLYSTYPLTWIYLDQTNWFLSDQTSGTLKLAKAVEICPAYTNFKGQTTLTMPLILLQDRPAVCLSFCCFPL